MKPAAGAAPVARRPVPSWLPWLALRLVSGAAAVLALSVIVFVATQALPSDPARVILGADAPEASVLTLRRQLGLDRPVGAQYLSWLASALHGDFGRSLDSHVPVAALVAQRLGNTVVLVVVVLAVVIPLSLGLGVALALRRDSRLDRAAVTGLIVLKAVPSFAIAIGLVMLFATTVWPLLPAVALLDPARPAWQQPSFLVLPVLTLVLSVSPYLVRLVRSSMIDALAAEHVTFARLRGIPRGRLLWRHALPHALVPVVQGAALTTSILLGGSLVVEVVFAYPGIGTALNAAVELRDVPVVQAGVLVVTGGIVAINTAADFLTVLLTPRLRTAARAARPFRWPHLLRAAAGARRLKRAA